MFEGRGDGKNLSKILARREIVVVVYSFYKIKL